MNWVNILLFYIVNTFIVPLQILTGKLEYHSMLFSYPTTVKHESIVDDGEWHNVTLIVQGKEIRGTEMVYGAFRYLLMFDCFTDAIVTLIVDEVSMQQTAMNAIHDVLGADISRFTVGGNVDLRIQNSRTASGPLMFEKYSIMIFIVFE